jgi:CheY-like chemotaxis protein
VEDNAIVREQTTELLESNDRNIVACESAEQALNELNRRDFDVLITDMSLPAMSGMELTKRVLERNPSAWIVILSGYILKAELGKLGPNVRTLAKPFETEQLDVILNEVREGRLS